MIFFVNEKKKWFTSLILQVHSFITALNYLMQWVAIWTLLDRYTSDDWRVMLITSMTAILATSALTGHLCDLVCTPFIISYDSIHYNVRIATPFVMEKISQSLSHLVNYIFYEYIISLLTILAWRGPYKFLDVYLHPNDENMSAGISLLLGYLLFFLLMYTQSFEKNMGLLSVFISLNYPSFLQNLRHLCAFCSCVLLWRGFWILFDAHIAASLFVYQSPYLFYIITMIMSFSILSVMKTASSINGPMSHIDDEYNLFPLYPNCFLMQWFTEKKELEKIPSKSNQITKDELSIITLF